MCVRWPVINIPLPDGPGEAISLFRPAPDYERWEQAHPADHGPLQPTRWLFAPRSLPLLVPLTF